MVKNPDPFYGYMLDVDTIEIKCAVVPEYQITDRRNKTKELLKIPGRKTDKAMMSVDRCSIERSIASDVEDAYVIEGWGLCRSWDNALVRKYVVLIPLGEYDEELRECIIATTSSKYRSDIPEVFPDEKNTDLAGFVCRIPFSELDPHRRYRIGVLLRKITGLKSSRLALGDIYEPRRGIVKEE
jgi:hypothetical protein